MSSFELLELFGVSIEEDAEAKMRTIKVEFAPEDGALAAAMRVGERPEWKQMLAQSANELAIISVVQAPDADRDEYGSRLFLPVDRMRELADEDELRVEQMRESESDGDGMSSMWQIKN